MQLRLGPSLPQRYVSPPVILVRGSKRGHHALQSPIEDFRQQAKSYRADLRHDTSSRVFMPVKVLEAC